MFGLNILDTAIGLVFVYLLLSLTCTALNEWIAGMLSRRSKTLYEGIKTLLEDPKKPTLLADFYAHPLVQDLHVADKMPAYVQPKTFSLVLLDLLVPSDPGESRTMASVRQAVANLPADSTTRKTLSILLDQAGDSLLKLEQDMEAWFNGAMDRVSGWYKQRTQVIVLTIAALLSIATNADTFAIATALANNSALREVVVTQAKAYTETAKTSAAPPANQKTANERIAQLQQLGIPLGWKSLPSQWDWLNKLAGLALTAFAVSLGAPFWFDLLNRFMNIRAGGKSPEERAKPPDVPKPA
ncbi:MAG TPA: hypothetical protein VEO02_15225 [Thermoanaerobaculia bacterium]|nr:hypothetical protein [Thermoanaerobaculia bacterium]